MVCDMCLYATHEMGTFKWQWDVLSCTALDEQEECCEHLIPSQNKPLWPHAPFLVKNYQIAQSNIKSEQNHDSGLHQTSSDIKQMPQLALK